jgi:exopolysaccharide production protein ExoZ
LTPGLPIFGAWAVAVTNNGETFRTGRQMLKGEQLPGVTMLRGIAVLLLVVHHTLEASSGASVGPRSSAWLTRIGEAGVDILFVVSGFMMLFGCFAPGQQATPSGRFLLRRLARVYPFYWVCCAAFLAIWSVGFLKSRNLTLSDIVDSLLLIPTSTTLIGPSWILSYLVYFYLIFAASLQLRSRDASIIIATAAMALLLALAQFMPNGDARDFLAKPIALEFGFGLLLARGFLAGHVNVAPTWSLLGFAALALAPPLVLHPDEAGLLGIPRVIVWGLPAVLLIAAFLRVDPPKTLTARCAFALGQASYALYLTHFFVMIFYEKLLKDSALGRHSQIAVVPAVIAVCILVGLLAYRVVERPLVSALLQTLGPTPTSVRSNTSER